MNTSYSVEVLTLEGAPFIDCDQYRTDDLRKGRPTLLAKGAVFWALQGFRVIPIRPGGKELPPTTNGGGLNYQHATADPALVDRWWNAKTGTYKGHNIGLALQDPVKVSPGIIVLDLDPRNNPDVGQQFEERAKELKVWPIIELVPMQETPGDGTLRGRHYFFTALSLPGSGLDRELHRIRTAFGGIRGLDVKGSGHVVFAPSIRIANGRVIGTYQLRRDGQLLPLVFPDFSPPEDTNTNHSGRGNEEVGDHVEPRVPVARLEDLLRAIPARKVAYSEWLAIGMAIHSQYPTAAGLALWDQWSSTDPDRYQSDGCSSRWRGFKVNGPTRIGTLVWHAQQNGWKPNAGEQLLSEADEQLQELNRQYAHVVIGKDDAILRVEDGQLIRIDAFKRMIGRRRRSILLPGRDRPMSLVDYWIDGYPFRRSYPKGMGLFPPGAEPEGVYNLWRGFSVTPRSGDWSLFGAHIDTVICGGDKRCRDWLLDWIADLFQDWPNPKGCAVILRGGEGTGKGTLANTIGEIVAEHYVHLTHDRHLTGNFNAHLARAVVVHADEVTWGGYRKHDGVLKGLVTERDLMVEFKGIDAQTYRNIAHLIISSNAEWVIPAGTDSRRWLVLDVSDIHAQDEAYFAPLYTELANGGREAFLYDMLNRQVKANLRVAPRTLALVEQRVQSSNRGLETFLAEWVEDPQDVAQLASGEWYVRPDSLWWDYQKWVERRRRDSRAPDIRSKDALMQALRRLVNTNKREYLTSHLVKLNAKTTRVTLLPPRQELALRLWQLTNDESMRDIADADDVDGAWPPVTPKPWGL